MPETELSREEDLRQLLTDAIEVQLAALKAGITFWSDWIEKTSTFVDTASKSLSSIVSEDQPTKDVVLELVDAARASARAMTELPRNTATAFIAELDRLAAESEASPSPSAAARTRARSRSSRGPSRPKRAGRVKA